MTTLELQNNIVRLALDIEDPKILTEIWNLLITKTKSKDWWSELSMQEQQYLDESAEEANQGLLVTHNEVMSNARALIN
jgi:TRAP-type C4-dicarboxylate transport system substrate-binding protein